MEEVRSTCCYCGVGCGVVVETDGGTIVGVRGDVDHPANFGRLCTKGSTLHLSTGLATRALYPELRTGRDVGSRTRCSWDEALDFCARRFAEIIRRAWAGCRGFLRFRPASHRGLLRLQQARQGLDRHQQHRHQLAAVHVVGRRPATRPRSGGRAAGLLRGHRSRRVSLHCRLQHGVRAPDPVPAHRGRAAEQSRAEDHRRRSAPHRHRTRGGPAPRDPAGYRCGALQQHAPRVAVGRTVQPRIHRGVHGRLRRRQGYGAGIHARRGGANVAECPPSPSSKQRSGSADRRRRSRSIARGSTSRATARRTTRR